ncbi:hypothetical protein B6S12_04215 [Helicobacter valdiviensis]|uniref:DUF2726 domain-containing protein n=1 Tax=Helicobacter valdiviensis TaxID=1458358 RepID=A0A2W6PNW9_9HELI|nr:DUF2726 domain-containing protein [Helicobacter valdiviensis]PZT48403.1 hypothetical protein B6S12_04215 [Helicobacter valdiviensis]
MEKEIVGIVILCVCCFVVYKVARLLERHSYEQKRQRSREYWEQKEQKEQQQRAKPEYKFSERLEYISSDTIKPKKLMNKDEYIIYYELCNVFKEEYMVSPQVSYKAFLSAKSEAWKGFGDFYCDFLITHKKGLARGKPVCVIEYHGGGHYGFSNETKQRVQYNDDLKQILFGKITSMVLFVIKEEDIKSKNFERIDEGKLKACIANIQKMLI